MGTIQSKYQGRYKHLNDSKIGNQPQEPERTTGITSTYEVVPPCFAPLATAEDVDDVTLSPSPSSFSMPPFDDVIRRMTSVNQNADPHDPNDYDDESINISDFDEDSISMSWADSFHSSTDNADRISQCSAEIVSQCGHNDEVVESPVPPQVREKKTKKTFSIVKRFRKRLRRYKEKKERKRPKGWVWWTPEGTLCVCDENGEFYQEHHVMDKMRFRRNGQEVLRYWVSQDCNCSD